MTRTWTEIRPYEWPNLSNEERTRLARECRKNYAILKIPESEPQWDHARYRDLPKPAGPSTSSAEPKRGITSRDAKKKATEAPPRRANDVITARDERVNLVDLDRNRLVMQEAVLLLELLQGNLLVLDTRVRRGATLHLLPIQITFQLRQLRYRGNLTSLLPLIPLMHRHPMTAPPRTQVLTKVHRVSLLNPEILYLLQVPILTPPKSRLKDRKSTSNARLLQYVATMKRRCPIEIGIDRSFR